MTRYTVRVITDANDNLCTVKLNEANARQGNVYHRKSEAKEKKKEKEIQFDR